MGMVLMILVLVAMGLVMHGLTYVVKSRALATLLSVVALGVVVVALVILFVYAVGSMP